MIGPLIQRLIVGFVAFFNPPAGKKLRIWQVECQHQRRIDNVYRIYRRDKKRLEARLAYLKNTHGVDAAVREIEQRLKDNEAWKDERVGVLIAEKREAREQAALEFAQIYV